MERGVWDCLVSDKDKPSHQSNLKTDLAMNEDQPSLVPNEEVTALIEKAARAEKRADKLRQEAIAALREQAKAKGIRGFGCRPIARILNESERTGIGWELCHGHSASHALGLIRSRQRTAAEFAKRWLAA
jgi:hypothetical protein